MICHLVQESIFWNNNVYAYIVNSFISCNMYACASVLCSFLFFFFVTILVQKSIMISDVRLHPEYSAVLPIGNFVLVKYIPYWTCQPDIWMFRSKGFAYLCILSHAYNAHVLCMNEWFDFSETVTQVKHKRVNEMNICLKRFWRYRTIIDDDRRIVQAQLENRKMLLWLRIHSTQNTTKHM